MGNGGKANQGSTGSYVSRSLALGCVTHTSALRAEARAGEGDNSALNSLEGCYHLYTPEQPTFPGIIVASGTEDFFSSSLYFAGPGDDGHAFKSGNIFRSENSGLTHFVHDKVGAEVSAYKMFTHDVFPFVDGFELVWRNVRCRPLLHPPSFTAAHTTRPTGSSPSDLQP